MKNNRKLYRGRIIFPRKDFHLAYKLLTTRSFSQFTFSDTRDLSHWAIRIARLDPLVGIIFFETFYDTSFDKKILDFLSTHPRLILVSQKPWEKLTKLTRAFFTTETPYFTASMVTMRKPNVIEILTKDNYVSIDRAIFEWAPSSQIHFEGI